MSILRVYSGNCSLDMPLMVIAYRFGPPRTFIENPGMGAGRRGRQTLSIAVSRRSLAFADEPMSMPAHPSKACVVRPLSACESSARTRLSVSQEVKERNGKAVHYLTAAVQGTTKLVSFARLTNHWPIYNARKIDSSKGRDDEVEAGEGAQYLSLSSILRRND